jgi:hypothetical protein
MMRQLDLRIATIAIIAVALLGACASSPATRDEPATRVALDESGRITYIGSITTAANARVMEIFDEASEKPQTVLISSGGGSTEAGMDLAEWILDHNLDVEVGDDCLSSCANYVFLAGNVKKLGRRSVLLWHGSMWQESWDRLADPASPEFRPSILAGRERETRFFDRIGVDNLITVYGQQRVGFYQYWRYFLRLFGDEKLIGFDYDLRDMGRFGVSNIELVDGEWNWRELRPGAAAQVRRIVLEEDYEFTLNRFGGRPGPKR